MSDYFDNVERTKIPFWNVYAKLENGKTKSVEIQAATPETAIRKGFQHYPGAVRVLISL